jgi:hypothetical protein
LTSIDTAITAARSLEPDARAGIADVRPLGEWMPAGALPDGRVASPRPRPAEPRPAARIAPVSRRGRCRSTTARARSGSVRWGGAEHRSARVGFGRQPAQSGRGMRLASWSVARIRSRSIIVGPSVWDAWVERSEAVGSWSVGGRCSSVSPMC